MSHLPKPTKRIWHIYQETATCRSLIPIKKPVVEPQNEFTVARSTTVPDDIGEQVEVKLVFSETFEWDKFDGKTVSKGEFHNIVTRLCKLQSQCL